MSSNASTSLLADSSPAPAGPLNQLTCGICRRQFSKYICPKCNTPYCSLTCFRSESHAECSEPFYRKEVETDIKSSPSKTAEERLKMMELLKRFEEDSLNDSTELLTSNEDDEDDLANRLSSVDLDTISSDALWKLLKPEERERFLKALHDPDSDLAKQLLASEEFQRQITEPWWEAPDDAAENTSSARPSLKQYGKKPEMSIRVSLSMVKMPPPGPSLAYNLVAIITAYAYVTRHLSISPLSSPTADESDRTETRRLITKLVPFLNDRKSRTLHQGLSSVTTDIWSRIGQEQISPLSFAVLLRDTARLLRPSRVRPMSPEAQNDVDVDLRSHPSSTVFYALSDLYRLFQSESRSRPQENHIAHKLTFYIAHVASTPTPVLAAIAANVLSNASLVEDEGDVPGREMKKREIEFIGDGTASESADRSAGKPIFDFLTANPAVPRRTGQNAIWTMRFCLRGPCLRPWLVVSFDDISSPARRPRTAR